MNGDRHWLHVKDFDKETVAKWLELMRTQAKDGSQLRLRKMWHTEFPSIQGPWTPFTTRDPSLNITKFPDVSLEKFCFFYLFFKRSYEKKKKKLSF